MTTIIAVYAIIALILALLTVAASRAGHDVGNGYVSFIALWPIALPYTLICFFLSKKAERK